MEGKTEEEVERYASVFKERYKELNGKQCILAFGWLLAILRDSYISFLCRYVF